MKLKSKTCISLFVIAGFLVTCYSTTSGTNIKIETNNNSLYNFSIISSTNHDIVISDYYEIIERGLYNEQSNNPRSIAEYEPVKKMLIVWPKWWSPTDGFRQEPFYVDLIKATEDIINITIFVDNKIIKGIVITKLTENKVPLANVSFSMQRTDSIWIGDFGPFFIENNNHLEIVDFNYFHKSATRLISNMFPTLYAIKNRIKFNFLTNFYLTIQGGNYMTDGTGTGFVADKFFNIDNPNLSKNQTVSRIKQLLGLKNVIILRSQVISLNKGGDGTGHLDMFAKLLNETTVLVGRYNDTHDVNHQILEYNAQIFKDQGYNVVRIPMIRDPVTQKIWTYTNSLIVNGGGKKVVLVPQYNVPEDKGALLIYGQFMPGYEVRGVDSSIIIKSCGAIHCTAVTTPKL